MDNQAIINELRRKVRNSPNFDVPTAENRELSRKIASEEQRLRQAEDAKLSPLDRLYAAYEASKAIGTGLAGTIYSLPFRSQGEEEVNRRVNQVFSAPKTAKGQEYLQNAGKFLESLETDYKIPAVLPGFEALQVVAGPAKRQAGQIATKAGMALEKSLEGPVTRVMERGGLPAELLEGLTQGSTSHVVKPPRMSAEEARSAGYWHPIGLGKKLEKPYQEMTFKTEDVKNLPQRKAVSLEDLQGQYIVPAVGDRTAAGKLLTEVEDVKFQNPVTLEGGPDFMLTHGSKPGSDSTIWASGQSIVSALRNRALQAEQQGGKANLVYVPMGYDSLNFSTMPVDAALEMIRSGKITKKAKKQFDSAVKSFRPEFVGVDSPEAVEQLHKTGALRHAFLDRMQLDDFQNAGFPHLSSIRKAIMEPALADVPNYHGGYSIGQIDTSKPINKAPLAPHNTYDTQLHGHVVGGMDTPVPHTMLWRDFFADRRARQTPTSGDRIAFERSKPLQLVDQRLLDDVMPYVEALRRRDLP